ncbi:uncharacterized protein LOC110096557 [Dendrobium catenatum]|uniref:DUF674 domain-containing protein n=1 Tax=Dendrobium catenatum TaxID=906689 RepID=A0A2I0W002_9ASPA|nr:uncharacterized protein LOC110096557 [Dendrobium catenatum]PKU68978.1 hypothetical protein MA16_Dca002246 [Dendrobium catenatum]
MADEKRLSLNAWVDKDKKRVVFAEADSDFVDVLFSFLTIPLGTIIKLLSNNSGLGCMDNLYDSIKQLSDQHFSTEACKNMLLSPCSAAAEYSEKLKLNVYDPRELYLCKMDDCISRTRCYYSSVWQTRCYYCDKFMDEVMQWKNDGTIDAVFVKKNDTKFMITDDFHVTQSSVKECYDRLNDLDVKDINLLEEWILEFGREELLNLLKESLKTKEALTNICFPDLCIQYTSPQCNNWMEMITNKSKDNAEFEIQEMLIRLIVNITNNKVVCVEVGKEFADQLFSFLTFPLGSVLKLIGYSDSFGCMNNLYDSIHELKIKYFKSEEAKSMLISPKLAPFFGYRKQMLYMEESSPLVPSSLYGCQKCYWDNNNSPCSTVSCKHGVQQSHFIEMDPMLAKADTYMDEGFVRSDQNFLVTDDLHVTPMSLFYFLQILKRQGLHVDQLEYGEMVLERAQVYNLLEAMLVSKTALSDALSSRKWNSGIVWRL